jgi:LPXTG-motif cell wall-anchored protein
LYGPGDENCSGTPVFTSNDRPIAEEVATAESEEFVPTEPGTYRWRATYSGDENYDPISHPCNAPLENVVVGGGDPEPEPRMVTQVSPSSITLGQSFTDTVVDIENLPEIEATQPTGEVTFRVHGPDDATCSNEAVFTTVETVGDTQTVSDPITPTQAGTYRVIASYSGDENYPAVTGECNDPGETVVVTDPDDNGGGGNNGGDEDDDSSSGDDDDDSSSGDEDDDDDKGGSGLPDTGAGAGLLAILVAGLSLVLAGSFVARTRRLSQ